MAPPALFTTRAPHRPARIPPGGRGIFISMRISPYTLPILFDGVL